jgi:hypothetical protein
MHMVYEAPPDRFVTKGEALGALGPFEDALRRLPVGSKQEAEIVYGVRHRLHHALSAVTLVEPEQDHRSKAARALAPDPNVEKERLEAEARLAAHRSAVWGG